MPTIENFIYIYLKLFLLPATQAQQVFFVNFVTEYIQHCSIYYDQNII